MNKPRECLRDPAHGPVRIDSHFVTYRLEEAGATLLALPSSGYTTRLRASKLEFVASAAEAFGGKAATMRAPVPSASRITRMDEALGWIALIPQERYVIRRIVGARSLVSPVTERHLYSWRRLGAAVGADHKAVQRWHAQGIDMLVAAIGALQSRDGRGALPCPAHGAAGTRVRVTGPV
jgi:hypothetical protein